MNIDKVYYELGKLFHENHAPIIDLIKAQTNDPFKILVGTILSARTKDETTSKVVDKLFSKIQTHHDLVKLTIKEIEELIYPVGFYHQKAIYLKELPKALDDNFNGRIPNDIDDLITLPGVGRKTANLVKIMAFDEPAMCVDVHVHRISNRLGYIKTTNPYESELALRAKLPVKYWLNYNSYLVSFGQNHCKPINPKCNSCPIYNECSRINVITKYSKEK